MTRNTKLYRVAMGGDEYVYRTLTVTELTFLGNISNEYYRHENAVKLALTEGSIYDLNYPAVNDLGKEVIKCSQSVITNDELFNVTVQSFRATVQQDTWMNMTFAIMNVIPGFTFEYLMNLTYTDLLELVCVAERVSNKKILNIRDAEGGSTPYMDPSQEPHKDSGPKYMPDDDEGMSLQDKIKADQKYYKDSR
jgi:hypothetical protein